MYSELNIIIYIVLILILISIMYFIYKNSQQEHFDSHEAQNDMSIQNTKIKCLLIQFKDDDEEGHNFLSAYINTEKKPNSIFNNTLIKSTSLDLKNGEWEVVCKAKDPFPKGNIEYLAWHRDEKINNDDKNNKYKYSKRLMCIVKELVKDDKNKDIPVYNIYIKRSKELDSEWIPYMPDGKTQIKDKFINFIIYDLRNKLIGIHFEKKQIYTLNEKKCIWEGPINVSQNAKMKKIIFDWDRKMLGLDINNILWKKASLDWTTSIWKKQNNSKINFIDTQERSVQIHDLLHDTDGKLIGVSDEYRLIKQQNYNFNSYFVKYESTNEYFTEQDESEFYKTFPTVEHQNLSNIDREERTIMLSSDVFMNKTGIDTEYYDYINLEKYSNTEPKEITDRKNSLITKLNFLIEFKRKFVNKCKTNKNIDPFFENNDNINDQIEGLMNKISVVGYKNI